MVLLVEGQFTLVIMDDGGRRRQWQLHGCCGCPDKSRCSRRICIQGPLILRRGASASHDMFVGIALVHNRFCQEMEQQETS